MNFGKFNPKKIDWNVDTTNFEYRKLSTLNENTIVQVKGFYTCNDNLNGGKQAILITDKCFFNLPKHKVEEIEEIIDNDECVQAIKNGECFIKTKSYTSKKTNEVCMSFSYLSENEVNELKKNKAENSNKQEYIF